MKKYLFSLLALLGLATLLLAACDAGSAKPPGSTGPNTVHMNETKFLPDSITIKKGEKVTLVNDVSVIHVIQNGTWTSNGSAKSAQETGAPKIEVQVTSMGQQAIGPFNTTGTFQVYCIVHVGMNLTVIVQ